MKCEYDELKFSWDFPGASVGSFERLSKDWYHLHLRQDTWFWFYFKLEGADGRKIILQMRDRTPEMEKVCNYWVRHRGEDGTTACQRPRFSYDRKNWEPFEHSELDFHEPDLIRVSQTFEQDTVWICYGIPYMPERWQEFMAQFSGHPHLQSTTLGNSRLGYPVKCLTVTDFSIPASNKQVGWILCREDQAETTAAFALEGGMEVLMSPATAEIRKQLIINIVPMVSIDGIMCGSPFSGGYGYMTGRWQEECPPPEIAAVRNAIEKQHPHDSKIAFAGKLHGSVTWDNANYVTKREEDRMQPYFFANTESTANMVCKYLPQSSLELSRERLGIRPVGRFERYIHDNYDCDVIFASEFQAHTIEEARNQGRMLFKALLDYTHAQ